MKARVRRSFFLAAIIITAVRVTPSQHNVNFWTVDNGLPQNAVYSILQTNDGYLWFTTLDGLVRFDGVSFTIFSRSNTKGINSNRFNTLLEDVNNNLWIGTDDGGLTRFHNGKFTTYTIEDGLPSNRIRGLSSSAEGRLLVMTKKGPVQWLDERLAALALPGLPEATLDPYGSYYLSHSGALWYTDPSGLHRYKGGKLASYGLPAGGLDYQDNVIYEDSQGRLWIGTVAGGLIEFKDGRFTRFTVKDGLPDQYVTAIREDRQRDLWVGTRAGLARLRENRFSTYTTAQGLSGNNIASICEDREANLWVGTDNQGINRLTTKVVEVYTKQNGLSTDTVYPIFQDHARDIWIGGTEGNLTRYNNGIFTTVMQSTGHPFESTTALGEDRQGRLWIGRLGAILFMKDGRLEQFDPQTSLGGVIVRAIHQDRDGDIWFATSAGLLRYKDEMVARYTTDDGLAGNDAETLLEDRKGRLWIGTYGGLSLYEQGRFTSFTEADGLASNRVRSLYEDNDGSLWIGTYDGGLSRLKGGRFTRYTINDGLFNNGVFCILEDGRRNLWMSSNRGIYRASLDQLNDFADGKVNQINCISYGKQDGLLNIECNGGRQPAGYKMADGKLWFPTQGGVAVIDPEALSINLKPPPVVIEKCLLQREEVDSREIVEVRPGRGNLEIHYTGLSFINPEQVRFRYKLDGMDSDWIEVGTRRIAYYSYLPPGNYTFNVIAANRDGVWSAEAATLKIVVIPPFWRTWWFTTLVGLAIAGAAFLAYRHRVEKMMRAHAAQETFSRQLIESQERERKRIAAELHDSLGQNLLVMKNRAMLGTMKCEEHPIFKEQFDLISASASQALDEVRQIAYNLRPYQLDQLGLTNTIDAMIENASASTAIRFTTSLASVDGLFSQEAEINVYRIVQECVNNIIKHAQATEARVEIKRSERAIQIIVEDNGRGFAVDGNRSGNRGIGLTGISERVKMLGGTHTIDSAVGHGTTLTIKINLADEQDDKK